MSVQEKGVGENIVIVDATSQILGRLASRVAKLLLEGKKVIVVNVEKAVVSGDPVMVIEAYKKLFNVSNFRDLEKQGIRRPRNPINLFRRTVRGMLPYKKPKGREALRRLTVHLGVPEGLDKASFIRFEDSDASKLPRKYITLGELAKQMGWKGESL